MFVMYNLKSYYKLRGRVSTLDYYVNNTEDYLGRQSIRNYIPLHKHAEILSRLLNIHPDIGTEIKPPRRCPKLLACTDMLNIP